MILKKWPLGRERYDFYTDASGGPYSRWPQLRKVAFGTILTSDNLATTRQVDWWEGGGFAGEQTVNKGELHAVVYTMQRALVRIAHVEERTITVVIHVDSDYVFKNWNKGNKQLENHVELWG